MVFVKKWCLKKFLGLTKFSLSSFDPWSRPRFKKYKFSGRPRKSIQNYQGFLKCVFLRRAFFCRVKSFSAGEWVQMKIHTFDLSIFYFMYEKVILIIHKCYGNKTVLLHWGYNWSLQIYQGKLKLILMITVITAQPFDNRIIGGLCEPSSICMKKKQFNASFHTFDILYWSPIKIWISDSGFKPNEMLKTNHILKLI